MISLKVRIGRLISICQRGIEKSKLEQSEEDGSILSRAKSIHAQSILKKKVKDIYKKEKNIIYSFALLR
jgi:transposase, IS5 family